ncbi:lactoylglutathione lyase and related lyases [Ruminococcus sp. CAG:624]|nr:lactoylglutathione lyase and related lyases [Ruminococcus sp. CAG:624]
MKYKGTLIVVKDCNRALKFYRDIFGFQLLQDNDGNMELQQYTTTTREILWKQQCMWRKQEVNGEHCHMIIRHIQQYIIFTVVRRRKEHGKKLCSFL